MNIKQYTTHTRSIFEDKRLENLRNEIIRKIRENDGEINFSEFMQLALYSDFGYYSSKEDIIGEKGDFITAPEISPLFAYCLAVQCKEILQDFSKPNILEIGAGNGTLAKDLLNFLHNQGRSPKKYFILETSKTLRLKQKQQLAEISDKVDIEWVSALPKDFNGIIIANEVLDALPVHKFKIKEDNIYEYFVKCENNIFQWDLKTCTNNILNNLCKALKINYINEVGEYSSEINLNISKFLKAIYECCDKAVIIFSDYGYPASEYYHPQRSQGTLACFYRHNKNNNPLERVGEQDITAHVDFTYVAEQAVNLGCSLLGYTNQAAFLLNCGLLELVQDFKSDTKNFINHTAKIKTLTSPGEMGELIKFIALGKNYKKDLLGFKAFDKSHQLIEDKKL